MNYYLFITYIVTSKPKRISVAAGFVHIINLLIFISTSCLLMCLYYAASKCLPCCSPWTAVQKNHE